MSNCISPPIWQRKEEFNNCYSCKYKFGWLLDEKNHCRRCGFIFCDNCTSVRMPLLPLHSKPVRLCSVCYQITVSDSFRPPSLRDYNLNVLKELYPSCSQDILLEFLNSNNCSLSSVIKLLSAKNFEITSLNLKSNSINVNPLEIIDSNGYLNYEQKVFFYENGYLILRNAVSKSIVDDARGLINECLGKSINKKDYHASYERNGKINITYCPELSNHPALLHLFTRSGGSKIVESVLGKGKLRPPISGQIALVFPNAQVNQHDPRSWYNKKVLSEKKLWHIDGTKRYEPDEIMNVHNFSVLFGIYLSKIQMFGGNFTIFPGSHKQLESKFREPCGLDSLVLDGLPYIELAEPVLVCTEPGDVILTHYQTAHHIAPNISPDIRYAIYFRIYSNSREDLTWKPEALTNVFMEFEGMWDIVRDREGDQSYMVKIT